MMSSETSWVCADAVVIAITAAMTPPKSALKVASLGYLAASRFGRFAVRDQPNKDSNLSPAISHALAGR
jgi:hypothetical protein